MMVVPASAMEVKNDYFTVTVPDDIAAICDIETGSDTVTFFEKISHQDFGGGFTGTISLFESVRDYGNMPGYRRGGQIDLSDGSKLDVVLQLPTDVPYDIQSEESTNNFKLLSHSFLTDIASSIVPADGVFTPQDEIDTTGIYADILETLRKDVEKEADIETLEKDGFSGLYSYLYKEEDPLSKIGYAYIDLNYDGYSELVLGMMDDPAIYDLYTQLDGEVIRVLCSKERDVYTLTGSEYGYHSIKETASGGADLTHIVFYELDPAVAELYQQVTFIYDGQTNPEEPYSIEYLPGDAETFSEEEWNERIGNFGEDLTPDYTPLA